MRNVLYRISKFFSSVYELDTNTADIRESRVHRVILHEEYDRNYQENDIAILKLTTLMQYSQFIQPICITNDTNIFSSTVGVVPGWGLNEHNNNEENILTKGSFPIKSFTDCRKSDRSLFPALLNGNNFCAGYQNGTSVCSGDSGGGLIMKSDGQWYVRGIVSVGFALPNSDQCDIAQLVIFTDVPKFVDWIGDKLQN